MKGNLSDKDVKFLKETTPAITNTPEAYKFLLSSARALEERSLDQRDFYLTYREKTGSLDGASKAWTDFTRSTPIASKNPKTGLPIFYSDFKRAASEANPGMTDEQISAIWRTKYGGFKK
jgi:hypothetical protein